MFHFLVQELHSSFLVFLLYLELSVVISLWLETQIASAFFRGSPNPSARETAEWRTTGKTARGWKLSSYERQCLGKKWNQRNPFSGSFTEMFAAWGPAEYFLLNDTTTFCSWCFGNIEQNIRADYFTHIHPTNVFIEHPLSAQDFYVPCLL